MGKTATPIDELMDRASEALCATEYFEAERLCLRALASARARADFERMARICLPLQEARRQRRQIAESSGVRVLVSTPPTRSTIRGPGCYLVQPPLIGLEARRLREAADKREVPILALAREPMTGAGKWPVVAVGQSRLIGMTSIRAYVDPPAGVAARESTATRDDASEAPPISWFLSAAEAVGDAAIARINPRLPAAFRVDQLMEFLDAIPDHEKLHQRLEEACRAAAGEPVPVTTLPRAWLEDKYRV